MVFPEAFWWEESTVNPTSVAGQLASTPRNPAQAASAAARGVLLENFTACLPLKDRRFCGRECCLKLSSLYVHGKLAISLLLTVCLSGIPASIPIQVQWYPPWHGFGSRGNTDRQLRESKLLYIPVTHSLLHGPISNPCCPHVVLCTPSVPPYRDKAFPGWWCFLFLFSFLLHVTHVQPRFLRQFPSPQPKYSYSTERYRVTPQTTTHTYSTEES